MYVAHLKKVGVFDIYVVIFNIIEKTIEYRCIGKHFLKVKSDFVTDVLTLRTSYSCMKSLITNTSKLNSQRLFVGN